MTAIRKSTLQITDFQNFTNLTTDLCTSNDRFGFKNKNTNTKTIYLLPAESKPIRSRLLSVFFAIPTKNRKESTEKTICTLLFL